MSDMLKKAQIMEKELVKFLSDIVAIPSLCGKEGAVIQRLKEEMESIGFDEVRVDGLGNLLGRIGNGPRTLVIDGHCDVVDVGERSLWKTKPFEPVLKDGVLYGRGTVDQKGGLGCAIQSARLIKEAGLPEDVTLIIIASTLEEDIEGLSWKYMVQEEGLKADAVLITEPTNLNLYRGHRGRLEMKVRTEGISCHGSAPERGENAIYKMAPIIAEIEQLHKRLKDDAFLGKGSVTISNIRSGSPSLCAVADSCEVHLDRRLTAGETIESALAEIEALPSFQKAGAKVWVPESEYSTWSGAKYAMQAYMPTWVLEEEHPVLRTAIQSYKNLFAAAPKVDKWTFSTNGVGSMGMFGIPTFGFGPGNEVQAHAPNEGMPIEHLAKATAFYAEFVLNF
ncbi:MAG: YgeY family selenium metabolism-linked hydrolase [Deferribacteres bacterium]|nr:YgeY family selenium metabolism-linked hydrolase [Deferribacteres bacterium]